MILNVLKNKTEESLKLIFNILIISLILIFILFIIFIFSPTNDELTHIEYKYKQLKTISSPKIILIGGSGTFYGIDSNLIYQKYKMNVINAGIYAGFGLRFMLDSMKKYINEGDILIIIPEHILFDDLHYYGDVGSFTFLSSYPIELINYIEKYEIKNFIDNLPKIISAIQLSLKDKVLHTYCIFKKRNPNFDYYNNFGDLAFDLKENIELKQQDLSVSASADIRIIQYLNNFYIYAKEKKINVMIYFSALPDLYYKKNKDNFDLLEKDLRKKLLIPIVSTIEDQVYPKKYFYDTIFHLTTDGKEIRTKKLINEVDQYLYSK